MGKIFRLETTVMYFLRKTSSYLKKFLRNSEEREDILDDLAEMTFDYYEALPEYCLGVVDNIKKLAFEEISWDEGIHLIKETIAICEILMQRPSMKTFKQLVRKNYISLSLDTRFSESFLYLFSEKLIAQQKFYEEEIQKTKRRKKREYYREKIRQNEIFWLAICGMANATETILLKAIRFARIEHYNFYLFVISIAYASKTTDKVMLALLKRVQKEDFGNLLSCKASLDMKTRLILTALDLNGSSVEVLKKVVQTVPVGETFYYDFFCYVIFHSCRDVGLLTTVKKRIEAEENSLKNSMQPSIKRLHMLLKNVWPEEMD